MSPDEEEKSEGDASEAQDAPVTEAAAAAKQPSAEAEQSSAGAGAPVADAGQPGTKTPAEQPSAGAEQSATTSAPASAPAEPRAAAAPVARPPAPPGRSAGPAPRSDRRGSGPPERGGRYFGRRKVCTFCVDKAKSVDYKDASKLRRFVSDRGRIEGRRRTGVCAKHQRWLAVALKRARHLALLPYTPEHIRSSGSFPSRR